MPSTWPVTNEAAGEARNTTGPVTSLGLADAPERDAVDDAGLERRVAEQARDLGRVDERRPDGVDVDAVLRPLGRPLAGERLDRALGGDVGRVPGVDAQHGPHGAQVHDPPAVAGVDHRPHRGLRRDDHGADVELHDPVPGVAGVRVGLEQDLAGTAADAVDDDVEVPEPLERGRDGALGSPPRPWRRPRCRWPRRPRPGSPSAVASALSRVRLATATCAPARASADAIALPIAPPPPGTSATLPSRLNGVRSGMGTLLGERGAAARSRSRASFDRLSRIGREVPTVNGRSTGVPRALTLPRDAPYHR